MDWGGTGATRVPSVSRHQLPVNQCNYHQLECAHQKSWGPTRKGALRYAPTSNQWPINPHGHTHTHTKSQVSRIDYMQRTLAFTDANHNFKRTSKPSSIQMYAV